MAAGATNADRFEGKAMEGRIKFFNPQTNFGVVEIDGNQSWFFHRSSITCGPVTKGDLATFELSDDLRRPGTVMAVDVRRVASAPVDPTVLCFRNASFALSEADLRTLFVEFGPVKTVRVCLDRTTGTPRGFGFVEMERPEDAAAAIENLDERELHGRRLSIRYAVGRINQPKRRRLERRSAE
jgi:cold-inducible RNA-binding protein